ncbi:MAG: hypothetical protein WBV39_13490 [Rudaea sp.]
MFAGIWSNPIRPKTIGRGAAIALVMLSGSLCAQPAQGNGGFSIKQRFLPNALPAAWNITISGQWPTQCPPTLQTVTLDGSDLRVDARSVLSLCERRAMPFSIELNPALALNRAVLPSGIYHVSFFAADGAQATPKLRAFSLIDRRRADSAPIVPETGFWWSTGTTQANADRTVLSIEAQQGQLSTSLMTYDGAGQPVWYFGSAPYEGRIASLSLLRLSGGSGPFSSVASQPHGDSVLTLDLQFLSSAHAQAWLGRARGDGSLQLQQFDLVRLPLAEAVDGQAWQGDWVLVTDGTDAAPQRIDLNAYQALDATHFQLSDSTGDDTLACSRDAAHPEWPPTVCSLHQSDGATDTDFNSVAISRMDGQRRDGTAVHLLRLSR